MSRSFQNIFTHTSKQNEFTATVAAAVLAIGFAHAQPRLVICKDGEAAIGHTDVYL